MNSDIVVLDSHCLKQNLDVGDSAPNIYLHERWDYQALQLDIDLKLSRRPYVQPQYYLLLMHIPLLSSRTHLLTKVLDGFVFLR